MTEKAGIEGAAPKKIIEPFKKASNLFDDKEKDYETPKELKYRTRDLEDNSANPRIKTKTRSKQKNLKKDKRSDDVKMEKFGNIKTGENTPMKEMTTEEQSKIANLK